ncbi:MAG: T9SS type A sorting domain-containing protein [Aquaticitalea sp.]
MQIQLPNIQTDLQFTKVELYDVLGKRVMDTVATNQLNIERFKSGIYFVKIHTVNGTVTKKLVIE